MKRTYFHISKGIKNPCKKADFIRFLRSVARTIYLIFLASLSNSCEDYYTADLDVVDPILVIESEMTNNSSENYVKITKTEDFYNTTETTKVTDTSVQLVQVDGSEENGNETSTGYFTFSSTLVPGKKYYIRITMQDNVYQSDTVLMPPVPTIDSLYTEHKIVTTYTTGADGTITGEDSAGREIYIDAPVSSSLQYYRFDYRAVELWMYAPKTVKYPPDPTYYGWVSVYDNTGTFNIAGPKDYNTSDKITRHGIRFLKYDGTAYLDSSAQTPMGWIFILDEYGTTKSSYDYHEAINKQLTAEGNLFDPVLTQVYGNIHCTSDESKTVLGFFDLNSYRQYRYYLYLGTDETSTVIQRRLNKYPDISNEGYTTDTPPSFWEIKI
jgi:hypothetical protein